MQKRNIYLVFLLLFVLFTGTSPCFGEEDFVTVTLPEKVIRQTLESTLPIQLNPAQGQLAGSLVLEKIDRFELGENSAVVHGLIVGKNLVLTTKIGDQDINLKLGEMRLPLSCDFAFRFDHRENTLYITPRLQDSLNEVQPGQADKVIPLLALLTNREYPVSFESMKKFQTMIGDRHFDLEMEPVDIQISQGSLVLKMIPRLRKTH